MLVKNQELNRPCHYPLNMDQEPDIDISVAANFMKAVDDFAKCPFMGYRAGLSTSPRAMEDQYTTFTYEQSLVYIAMIVRTLKDHGFQKGDRAAIYAKNSPFWLLSDIAIQILGGVSAPVYDTLGLDNIQYCIELVGAKVVLVSADYTANMVALWDQLPELKAVLCFDSFEADALKQQVHKLVVQLGLNGVVIDDTGSLFSMASKANAQNKEEEVYNGPPMDFSKVDAIITSAGDKKLVQLPHQGLTFIEASIAESRDYLIREVQKANVQCTDESSVIFTSGTSGKPKGVVQTNRNVMYGVASLGRCLLPYHLSRKGVQNSFLSYLPLAHVFEHAVEHGIYRRGYLIYYSSGNIKNLTKDMALAKPSFLIGVPRVFQKVYDSVMGKLQKSSVIKRSIFNLAFFIKKLHLARHTDGVKDGRHPVDVIFKAIQQALGGNVEFIACGSSAISSNVRQFLEVTSGAKVVIGYGMTETSCVGAYCYPGQVYESPSQLGAMTHNVEARVVDRSDACEYKLEADRIGELMIKGPMVAKGYVDGTWGQLKPIANSSGFYATGDLVKLHSDNQVSFLRRVGLVVKLQHGEFVDLELVESALESSPLITVAFVHAEADKAAPIAIVSVDSAALKGKVGQTLFDQFSSGDEEAVKSVEKMVFETGSQAVRAKGLKGFNVPKAYKVFADVDWTTNTDFYTPSMKKKHQGFVKAHTDVIQKLWLQVAENEHGDAPVVKDGGHGKILIRISFVVGILVVLLTLMKMLFF